MDLSKILNLALKILVSIMLFWLSYSGFSHGSSAGFELGIGALLGGLFHWVLWPGDDENKAKKAK